MVFLVHKTWSIISEEGAVTSLDGQLMIFVTEQDAIKKAAKLMDEFPHRTFRIKKLTFEIPQQ